MTSGRAPSLARTGPTTPSRCWSSASSRCSGSIDWWLCWSASDCAACIASWALTVNFSNLITVPSLSEIRAGIVTPQRLEFFVELALGRREIGRHDDLDLHELIPAAAAAGADPRHPIAGQPERPPARRGRQDLHRDFAPQRRHLDVGAQCSLGRRDRQLELDVVALPLEERVRGDGHGEIEVAAAAGDAGALAGHAHALSRLHAGRDLHVELSPSPLPAAAAKIPEDRAEEVGEIAAIAALVLDAEPAARLTGSLLGVALPVGAERVVAAALLRIGEHLVRLVDLLEAVGRVLALGDVGMVLAGQPAEGGLDRLVVGLPIDAEDLVVVLELDGHI